MPQAPLGRRQALVDRVADQRVHERQGLFVADDLDAGEVGERLGGAGLRQPGQRRHRRQGGAVAQDGGRSRDDHDVAVAACRSCSSTLLEMAREPDATTRSACEASGRTPSAARACSSWQSRSGLPEVVRWQAVTNKGPRAAAEASLDQLGRRLHGQRRGSQDERLGLERQLGHQVLVVGCSPVRTGGQDQHRYGGEPSYQVRQEAQRGAVTPLRVVDGEHQRSIGA